MKYYNNPEYTMVGNGRCITLFKFIFGQYEDFCKTIFPHGFQRSGFHMLFYPTAEYEYWIYRRRRAYDYKEARKYNKAYRVKPLISFESFAADFKAPKVNAELCMLQLFIKGIQDIFNRWPIVHNGKFRCFNRHNNDFQENMEKVIPLYIADLDKFQHENIFSFRDYDYNNKVDFKPVYIYLFKLLKQKKLDWRYQEIDTKVFAGFMDVIEKHWAELQIQKILSDKSNNGVLIDPDIAEARLEEAARKEDEEQMFRSMKIPQTVEAYYQVYQRLPQNYPPVEGMQ